MGKNKTAIIGIATNRSDTLAIALTSIINQTVLPEEIVICNQGYTNVMSNYQVRFVIDILSCKGVEVSIKRFPNETGAPLAKRRVLQQFKKSPCDICVMMDDDHILDKKVIENFIKQLKDYNICVPLFILPNNEAIGEQNFIDPLDYKSEGILYDLYTYRHSDMLHKFFVPVLDGCMAFKKETLLKVYKNIQFECIENMPVEMKTISKAFLDYGKGVITGDVVWHMIIPNKNSIFNNMDIENVKKIMKE